MKVEDHRRRQEKLASWPVNIVSYRVGDLYFCQVDNSEPGAIIARSVAPSRQEAEKKAIEDAKRRLERTRVVKP